MKLMKSAFSQPAHTRSLRIGFITLAAVISTVLFADASSVHAQELTSGMMQRPEGKSSPSRVPQRQEKEFPTGASWLVISLDNKNYSTSSHRPYFTLDSQFQLRGFGGCNTFSAVAYPLRNQGFAVSPFAVTRKSCGAEIDAAERAFLLALRMSQKWDVVKGFLILQGPNGTIRADRAL